MYEPNSKIKSEENFYFVNDLYDWNDYFGGFFTSFQQITEEFESSNENYIEQTIEITNNVDELRGYDLNI